MSLVRHRIDVADARGGGWRSAPLSHRVVSVVLPTAGLHVGLETADLPQIYGLAARPLRFAVGLPTLHICRSAADTT